MSRCPICNVRTDRLEYEGVRVRQCPQCSGYWVTPMSVRRIMHEREQSWPEAVQRKFIEIADASDTRRRLTCPTCREPMRKESFKGWREITIDQCPTCKAIWLDPGELEKIQIFWEYFRDHPEQTNWDALERQAALESELVRRKEQLKQQIEDARTAARHAHPGYAPHGLLRGLFSILRS